MLFTFWWYISTKESIRVLRMILDIKINWKFYTLSLKCETKQSMNIKCVQGVNFELDRKTHLWIYLVICRSKLEYGSAIKYTFEKVLEQKEVLPICTGVLMVSLLCQITGILSLLTIYLKSWDIFWYDSWKQPAIVLKFDLGY